MLGSNRVLAHPDLQLILRELTICVVTFASTTACDGSTLFDNPSSCTDAFSLIPFRT